LVFFSVNIASIASQCISPVSHWPQTEGNCEGNGVCDDTFHCICNPGFSGKDEFIDLTGTDCQQNLLGRQIMLIITCIGTASTSGMAWYRLWTLWPLKYQIRTGSILLIGVEYGGFCILCIALLAKNMFVADSGGTIFLFWICHIGAAANMVTKSQLFLSVTLKSSLKDSLGLKILYWVTWISVAIYAVISGFFLFAAAYFKGAELQYGMLVGFMCSITTVALTLAVSYIYFGNHIIRRLEKGMDKNLGKMSARIKKIRNQAVVIAIPPSITAIIYSCIPYLRVESFMYLICIIWIFTGWSNVSYVYHLKNSNEKNADSSGGPSDKSGNSGQTTFVPTAKTENLSGTESNIEEQESSAYLEEEAPKTSSQLIITTEKESAADEVVSRMDYGEASMERQDSAKSF